MMGDAPLVSVVTPVYNGATYLAECLESVLAQTYQHWTCAIVDNASTDATPEIARGFAERDSRFRHLRFDDFVDAAGNHNRAIAAISPDSEFCKVVQADDWLYPDCLTRMVAAASVSETIGVVSAYQLWGRNVHLDGLPYEVAFARGRDILRSTLLGEFNLTGGPTATMLRSAFVRERQPFYDATFQHHDSEAMLWMHSRHDVAFVHQILTYARRQPGSRMAWSVKMRSERPEEILFVLRYGRMVLDDAEYRARLRAVLRRYVLSQGRQFLRVSLLRDSEFFEFHRVKRRQILAAADGDQDVRLAMVAIGLLLLRGRKM
jgi:glycosyltransferase involved in cell wall biosynthesis